MTLSLLLFLIAFILILFLDVSVRILYGESFSYEIEIQPIRLVFSTEQKGKSKKKKRKDSGAARDWFRFVRKIIPRCKISINSLNLNFSASQFHSAFTGAAITAATLYPLIPLIRAYAEKMTIDKNTPQIHTEINEKTSLTPSVDISFELRLYYLIYLFIRYFPRRKKGARA